MGQDSKGFSQPNIRGKEQERGAKGQQGEERKGKGGKRKGRRETMLPSIERIS